MTSEIQIVRRGEGVVPKRGMSMILKPLRWGDYSAVDFIDGVAWFAGCVAIEDQLWYGSWISTNQL